MRFQQLTQNPGESLEAWADRLPRSLTLESRAYRGLPEVMLVIDCFCLVVSGKEAGEQEDRRNQASFSGLSKQREAINVYMVQ